MRRAGGRVPAGLAAGHPRARATRARRRRRAHRPRRPTPAASSEERPASTTGAAPRQAIAPAWTVPAAPPFAACWPSAARPAPNSTRVRGRPDGYSRATKATSSSRTWQRRSHMRPASAALISTRIPIRAPGEEGDAGPSPASYTARVRPFRTATRAARSRRPRRAFRRSSAARSRPDRAYVDGRSTATDFGAARCAHRLDLA